jgi:hypothetical protein
MSDEIKAQLQAALEAGISQESVTKAAKKLRYALIEEMDAFEYDLKDNLAHNLVDFVADMAKKTVGAILNGNDDEMRRYLGCERGAWSGRSDGCPFGRKREIDEWHPVIHGTLFESGAIALRRNIVAAHRDLITDERVKDLEDQVASLVEQNRKLQSEVGRLRDDRPF